MADYTLGLTAEEIERRLSLMNVDKTPVTMELLWENASPTNIFNPQTVHLAEIDANDGDIIVGVCMLNVTTQKSSISAGVLKGGKVAINLSGAFGDSAGAYVPYRGFEVNIEDNSIYFAKAYAARSTSESENNNWCIPTHVYVLKGVN